MNLRNLLHVHGVMLVVIGVAVLMMPETRTAAAGADVTPYVTYNTRLSGSGAIAFGVLSYLVSGMAHSPTRQAVVTAFFILHSLSLTVNVVAQRSGVVNATGWLNIGLGLLFTLAFGYFRFIRPEVSMTPGLRP